MMISLCHSSTRMYVHIIECIHAKSSGLLEILVAKAILLLNGAPEIQKILCGHASGAHLLFLVLEHLAIHTGEHLANNLVSSGVIVVVEVRIIPHFDDGFVGVLAGELHHLGERTNGNFRSFDARGVDGSLSQPQNAGIGVVRLPVQLESSSEVLVDAVGDQHGVLKTTHLGLEAGDLGDGAHVSLAKNGVGH
jgi:hypothetical protein